MTERIATEPQVIKDAQGIPLYVLLPYNEYMETQEKEDDVELPLEVVQLSLLDKKNLVKAWREYLGFTQKEVALRMGISQSTYCRCGKSLDEKQYAE